MKAPEIGLPEAGSYTRAAITVMVSPPSGTCNAALVAGLPGRSIPPKARSGRPVGPLTGCCRRGDALLFL